MIEIRKHKYYLGKNYNFYLGRLFITKGAPYIDASVFILHIKEPDVHFYIKGRGYPINKELLLKLKEQGVPKILLPEKGKTGFRVYETDADQYLKGTEINEPGTETQMSIPLSELKRRPLLEEKLGIKTFNRILYR